ncbi:MAG: DNA alkylation repair protein [SAR324 cluster bacterium]|nr:DNA alkylation repair protein [SAR324 cluster bacterium]
MSEPQKLPSQLREVFNKTVVSSLSSRIQGVYPQFKHLDFCDEIIPKLDDLNFGDRIQLIKRALKTHLPDHFPTSAQILIDSLGPEIIEVELSGDYGFYIMPVSGYIAEWGLDPQHYRLSMEALKEMTKRFTCEFAVRSFITAFPKETLEIFKIWAVDKNCHIRRLVSEGTRPRLPLAGRLPEFQKDPTPVLELLELLKNDPILLVRRSVANNLNDIGKDNPKAVVETLKQWQTENTKSMDWLIAHATRSLVKTGDKGTLQLLGFSDQAQISDLKFEILTPEVTLGNSLEISIKFTSDTTQKLVIDYAIHFLKANGKQKPKVFKWSVKKLKPEARVNLQKKITLKQLSTRTLYSGQHRVEILINGDSSITKGFTLNF